MPLVIDNIKWFHGKFGWVCVGGFYIDVGNPGNIHVIIDKWIQKLVNKIFFLFHSNVLILATLNHNTNDVIILSILVSDKSFVLLMIYFFLKCTKIFHTSYFQISGN